jgi:hypothetical protein
MPTRYRFINEKGEHLHTFDNRPLYGTSTVIGVIAKPLTWWASGLAVAELGWTNPKETELSLRRQIAERMQGEIVGMEVDEFLALLDKAYSAHSKTLKKAATKGTDMHAELEKYIKDCIAKGGTPLETSQEAFAPVRDFSKWACENVAHFLISEGHCYSEDLWVGGIMDCMAEMKDGSVAIIDFKSSKDAYDTQFLQVAAYDIEQRENGVFDGKGNNILDPQKVSWYYVIPFGAPKFKVEGRTASSELRNGFEAATVLHKLLNTQ